MTEKKEKNTPSGKSSLLEWITAAIGLIVVTGVLGFLIYRGATKSDTPPNLVIEVDPVIKTGENYLVKFRVANEGEMTAAAVIIEGELKNGEKTEESSDTTITYVPTQSTRSGGLIFTKNPNEFQFQIRAKGYEQP